MDVIGVERKIFYILVPGTSGTVDEKNGRPSFFQILLQKFFSKQDGRGIICETKQEHSLGEQFLKQSDAHLKNMYGQKTLVELAGLLSQSQLTISNDTGTVFLLYAVGRLPFYILGGGHFICFVPYPDLPWQTNHMKTVYHKIPCYGCNLM